MHILNSGTCLLAAAALLTIGCGKQERTEGVQLAKALKETRANFVNADAIEKDFVSSARAWCGGIVASGGGRGAELDQNAKVADELAKSAVATSTQLSQVRQAVDSTSLKEEFPRSIRNELTTSLTRRQRQLQDIRALLDQSAAQFREYRNSKAYVGDTYPDGVGKLGALLQSYKAPEDSVGAAIASLKEKFNFSDSEI